MKFRVEDIGSEEREETFSREGKWVEERLSGEVQRTFRFTDPIRIRLHLSRSGEVILMRSRVEALVEWICARCLTSFSRTLTSEFKTHLKPNPRFFPPEEVELNREDLETEFYEGEEIDATPLVQDQILLTLPAKAICQEECRGLCPRCGQNLNRGTCQCSGKVIDPRFESLKNFRVH